MKFDRIPGKLEQFMERIKADTNYRFTGVSSINLVIIVLNMYLLNSQIVGILTSAIYFLLNSVFLGKVLNRILVRGLWISSILGAFFLTFLIGLCGSVFIMLYILSKAIVASILVFLGIGISIVFHKVKNEKKPRTASSARMDETPRFSKTPKYLLICFLFLVILGFSILVSSRGYERSIIWLQIPQDYVYLYFVVVLITGFLIFSNYGTKAIFSFVVLYSLLLHSYIAVVCGTLYGSDPWGNLGELLTLVEQRPLGPFTFPQNLFFKPTRATPFSIEVVFSYLSQVDVGWFNVWLTPMLWVLFVPLTFFQIGRYVSNDRSYALLLCIVPSLFYQMILFGSFTVNASVGLIFLVLAFLCWINYLVKGGRVAFLAAAFVTLGSFLNYTLMFIVSAEVGVAAVFIRRLIPADRTDGRRSLVVVILLLPLALVVPFLDTLMGTQFKPAILQYPLNIVPSFFQWVIDVFTVSGIFATGIQPMFPSLRIASSILIWILVVLGLLRNRLIAHRAMMLFLAMLLIANLSYFIVWYLMDGVHPIGRYLVAPIYLFEVPLAALGLMNLRELIKVEFSITMLGRFRRNRFKRIIKMQGGTILICVLVAIASTSSYTVDPQTTWVSSNEVAAMAYIHDNTQVRYCVIAEPLTLYALQGISAGNVTSGNFQIINLPGELGYYQVGEFLARMLNETSPEVMRDAMNATNSDIAYFLVTERYYSTELIDLAEQTLGEYAAQFGSVYVFKWSRGQVFPQGWQPYWHHLLSNLRVDTQPY